MYVFRYLSSNRAKIGTKGHYMNLNNIYLSKSEHIQKEQNGIKKILSRFQTLENHLKGMCCPNRDKRQVVYSFVHVAIEKVESALRCLGTNHAGSCTGTFEIGHSVTWSVDYPGQPSPSVTF